jgi:nucleoside-diphosphate-sugar epimerase
MKTCLINRTPKKERFAAKWQLPSWKRIVLAESALQLGVPPTSLALMITAVTSYAIRPALAGKAVNLLGRTDQPHTFSYIADFGKLLATLGTREDTLGQIWFTPSPAPVTQVELVKIMEETLGQKVKYMAAGKMMMSFLGLFIPAMRESVEMLYEWDKPFIMDSSKAEKAFGWKGTPLKDAMQATIEWCRNDSGTH